MDLRAYVRPESLKILQERVGEIFIGISKDFLNRALLTQEVKARMNIWIIPS
jgi:hypothetical protein